MRAHGKLKGITEYEEKDPGSPIGILAAFAILILLLLLSWIF